MADQPTIDHPNRDKAASKATRATVILLLLASVALFLVVTIGGWSALVGAQAMQIFYIVVYLVMAFYVGRWKRGVLPVAAALAILTAVLAAIAAPAWFDRDKPGLNDPAIPPAVLGTLCIVLVGVSLLLIAFAMRAFAQNWHVEVEEGPDAAHPQAA